MTSFVMFGAALASEPVWPDLSESVRVGGGKNDAAVIVSVEDYAVVSDIPGAKANAVDWYTHLTEGRGIPASRVKLLIDNEGVRESIVEAAAQARDAVGPGGTLWFVFIGHGAPGRDGSDGLLVGWDTQQTASSLYARGVSQADLVAAMSGGAQAETVLVLDACFSGQGSGAGGALVAGLQPMIPTSALPTGQATVLSAGQSNEFAGPLPGLDRPAFSYLALGALRGWGDADGDGVVSAQEVADYSTGALAALPIGRSQTPQLVAPQPSLPLGVAREDGPSLAAIRKALLGETAPPAGSGDLASQLAQLQQLQAGESARQEEAEQLGDAVRSEAQALWSQVASLAEQGDEAGLLALQAFVQQYQAATVVIGGQTYPVRVPEVEQARQWIQSYGGAQASAAGSHGLRTDGYYRCVPKLYGGASSQIVPFVASAQMYGGVLFLLSEGSIDRKYATLREKVDDGRGGDPLVSMPDGSLVYESPAAASLNIQQIRPDAIAIEWTWLGMNRVHGAPQALTCPFVQR